MKVQELRNLLKDADKMTLEKMCVEIYKQLPRQKKEAEVDPLLTEMVLNKGTVPKKSSKPAQIPVDIVELEREMDIFLQNAYSQNYYAPNREIPKKERPKWRFIVKRYIKDLERIGPDNVDYAASAVLVKKLFELLSYACNCYLFSTENPFNSVGISQLYLCDLMLERTFCNGYTESNIEDMLGIVTTCGQDPELWHIQLLGAFVSALHSKEAQTLAVKSAHKMVDDLSAKTKNKKELSYTLRQQREYLCETALILNYKLGYLDTEIAYYCKVLKDEPKNAYGKILNYLETEDDDDIWLQFYEMASSKCEMVQYNKNIYKSLKGIKV